MKVRFAATFAAIVLSVAAIPSFAFDAATTAAEKTIPMKDGGTLYVFKDGKMALGNKYGRAISMEVGQSLEAADGSKITVSSNEVARLDMLFKNGHRH